MLSVNTAAYEELRGKVPHQGRWAPVYYEPMQGSGERITVAIVAHGENGEAQVRPVIRTQALRCLFGEDGNGVMLWVEQEAERLEQALSVAAMDIATLRPALPGFVVGESSPALYNDLPDLIDLGTDLAASLAAHSDLEDDGAAESETTSQWIAQVREVVLKSQAEWGGYFNRPVRMPGGRIEQKLGFYDGRMAAHFGVVSASRPRSAMYHMKTKLWDLSQLTADLVSSVKDRELLVARPRLNDVTVPISVRDQVRDVVDELTAEGDNKQVRVIHTDQAAEAGRRILRAA